MTTKGSTNDNAGLAPRLDWSRIGTAMVLCGLVLALHFSIIFGSVFFMGRKPVICFHFMYFRGSMGIPFAIIAALSVVALLAAGTKGDFKVKVSGLSLEGPSAPITMWVICFLVISLAIYKLFPEVKSVESLAPVLASYCS